ncbi:hypothetical protein [Streptomyces sp. NPDC046939]|uniref:hypothetical protein n=1 Tax=Streptomyces sp. NPDC046939 TaxID=3155376 RepID=UPI0033C6077A
MTAAVREVRYLDADNGARFKAEAVDPDALRPGDRVFMHDHPDGCVSIFACPTLTEPSAWSPGESVEYTHLHANWGPGWQDLSTWKVRTDAYTFYRIVEERV